MTTLADYQHKYRFIRFERSADGVLDLAIHNNGGPATWSPWPGGLHDELGRAFYDVGRDPENVIVIIRGTGDTFLTEFDWSVPDPQAGSAVFWDRIYKEGKDLLMNLLDIEAPVIGVVNGPAHIHSEIPTMSDIVLAAEHATFADKAHVPGGTVPGDGVHVWWQMLLGPNRGRHFLLTGAEIGAAEAKDLGIVAEVHPADRLLERAGEIARELAAKPRMMTRYSRVALVQHIKRRMIDDLGYGLQLEAMAATASMQMAQKAGA